MKTVTLAMTMTVNMAMIVINGSMVMMILMVTMIRAHSEVLLVTGNVGNGKADCCQNLVTAIMTMMMIVMTILQ